MALGEQSPGDQVSFAVMRDALDGDSTLSLTQRLIELIPAAVGSDGAAACQINGPNHRQILAASDRHAADAEALQMELGQGPCLLASGTGEIVRMDDFAHPAPELAMYAARAASATRYRANVSIPLRTGGHSIGAIDLYYTEPDPPHLSGATAHALAAYVAWAALTEDDEAPNPRQWMQETEERMATIHQAVGMIAARRNISTADAFSVLRGAAFTADQPLAVLAGEVVERRAPADLGDPDAA